jgi:hypothetical protein
VVTKIVITLKADSGMVGIERTDCDPVFFRPLHATLEDVLAAIPDYVEQANQKWATSPRNPVTQFQPPMPPPAAATTTTAHTAKPAATPAKPATKLQPNMF